MSGRWGPRPAPRSDSLVDIPATPGQVGLKGPRLPQSCKYTTPQRENRADVFLRAFRTDSSAAWETAEVSAAQAARHGRRGRALPGISQRTREGGPVPGVPDAQGERQASLANGDGQTGDRLEAAAPRHKRQSEAGERESEEQRGAEGRRGRVQVAVEAGGGVCLCRVWRSAGLGWEHTSSRSAGSGLDVRHRTGLDLKVLQKGLGSQGSTERA
ncbi:unnamed protein product [Arctogadus glacialis]